jgi:hypothetical protein
MSKKMRREFEAIAKSFGLIQRVKEQMGADLSTLFVHYTQKRADIADTIGRKKRR